MGGGNRRDRPDRSDEYQDREPDDFSIEDYQDQLAESGAETTEGTTTSDSSNQLNDDSNSDSTFDAAVAEAAESARETLATPEKKLPALTDTIDLSVVDEHTTNSQRARVLNAVLQGWLIEEREHNAEQVMAPAGTDADGLQDVGFWWDEDGYYSEGVQPMWNAAENVIDRDTADIETKPLSRPGQTVDYEDEMTHIAESVIGFSQSFTAKHFADENGEFTVYRKWRDDMAEKARAAKEADEAFTVNPRTLESHTLSYEKVRKSAEPSDVIASREINVSDVGVYLAAVAPGHAETEEITTLGHEKYTLLPNQITIVE
jgi:hypothetical protein